MKKKVIFFGTPSFAVTSLDKINSKFIVDCVVTAPDKRSGRGRKLNQSDVKKYTIKNKIKLTTCVFNSVYLNSLNLSLFRFLVFGYILLLIKKKLMIKIKIIGKTTTIKKTAGSILNPAFG
jgi:methionyl-tRNA formyltransferase